MSKKYRLGLFLLLLILLCMTPALAFAQTETQETAEPQSIHNGDIVHFTGNITIEPNEQIRGNVVAISGNIDVKGTVYGDVTALAGNIRLHSGSFVSGNVTAIAGVIEQEEGAIVNGRITSRERISGGYRYSTPHHYNYDYRFNFQPPSPWQRFSGWLLSLLGLLALTAAAVAVFPNNLIAMKKGIEAEPLRLLGIGFLGWLALPVVLLALTLTVIGIPVAILLAICLPILVLIGIIVMALFTGQQLDQALGNSYLSFVDNRPLIQGLKGIVLIWIVKAIPLVGWLVWPLAALIGMGTVLATRFGTNKPWFKGRNSDHQTAPNSEIQPDIEQEESDQPEPLKEQPSHETGVSDETGEGREMSNHEKHNHEKQE
ncbi:MAG: polymer-forming cytoskeletal protein [Thermacetogeniaceae bacterium]|nr:polymer-forming cytoskeletal protein [Syntrophomonadaceae bacterium]